MSLVLTRAPIFVVGYRISFGDAIRNGRLVVVNAALSGCEQSSLGSGRAPNTRSVDFWINDRSTDLSRVGTPPDVNSGSWHRVAVSAVRLLDLVNRHGPARYVKVDLEGHDSVVLNELFDSGELPDFVSSELHSISPFCALVTAGYTSFNLVDGPTVSTRFRGLPIRTLEGLCNHAFPYGSSGPFGSDIPSPWLSADDAFEELRILGRGWLDVHATKLVPSVALSSTPLRRGAWRARSGGVYLNSAIRSLARGWSLKSAINTP